MPTILLYESVNRGTRIMWYFHLTDKTVVLGRGMSLIFFGFESKQLLRLVKNVN